MPGPIEFTEQDIAFLVSETDRRLLASIDIIKTDATFVDSILESRAPEIVRRAMSMDQASLLSSITPRFLFEAMLRAARKDLAARSYTIERGPLQRIPVFDTGEVVRFLRDDAVVKYLARMLTSFTKIRSFSLPVRVRKGLWRRIRFNDMDIDSLMRYCDGIDEEQRFDYYKRIADLCLFIVGIFPEFAGPDVSFGRSMTRPLIFGRRLRSSEDYENEGRRFYKLASRHQSAKIDGSSRILETIGDGFNLAKKPLNYASERYLDFRKGTFFASSSSN